MLVAGNWKLFKGPVETAGFCSLLRARLANDPATELKIAAVEQMKITRLRLDKLLREHDAAVGA